MGDYTFDGKRLKKNSTGAKLGEIDRDNIRAFNGALLGAMDRGNIRDARGKKVAELAGATLKDDRGKTMITMEEIQELIAGEAGLPLAAMWYFFVKK